MNETTSHAKNRFQQRGIKINVIDYLFEHGEAIHAPHGAMKISLTRKKTAKIISALKREIKRLEQANKIVLIEKEGIIITGYHQT